MIKTLLGFVLLIYPFLFISKEQGQKNAFPYFLLYIIGLNLLVALITQALHIFTYPVVIATHLLIILIVSFKLKSKLSERLRSLVSLKSVDWTLLVVVVIAFLHLYSIHFNYSGKITVATTPQYQDVQHMKYIYPYFADEWSAVAFIKSSIRTHALPLINPLAATELQITNFEFIFHSFLAEIFVLLGLDPLLSYTAITIITSLIVVILIYLFLKLQLSNPTIAAITSLLVLYITSGANLPGLWTLIPLIAGIILLLVGFIFISLNNLPMIFLSLFLALLFYPPLFPFCTIIIISYIFQQSRLSKSIQLNKIWPYMIVCLIVFIVIALPFLLRDKAAGYFVSEIFLSKILYPVYIADSIPQYAPWYIIPIVTLLFGLLGIVIVSKRTPWLNSTLWLGIIFWAIYSIATFRIIIEYQRVVIVTSILLTIIAGYGINAVFIYFKNTIFSTHPKILHSVLWLTLVFLFIMSFNYTKDERWQKLTLLHKPSATIRIPAAPANNYLQPDDLRLFKNIQHLIFLSLPWKGVVIGIATDNFPSSTKAGNVTVSQRLYYEFMNLTCEQKFESAKNSRTSYVYSEKFSCPDFELIEESKEGLYLYRFNFINYAYY